MITDLKINEENKKRYYEQGYWTEKTVNDIWNDRVCLLYTSDAADEL